MDKIEKTEKLVEKEVQTFLSDKPYWVWLVSYIVVTIIIVLAAYLIFKVLTLKFWVIALLVLAAGAAWGTISYANRKETKPQKEEK